MVPDNVTESLLFTLSSPRLTFLRFQLCLLHIIIIIIIITLVKYKICVTVPVMNGSQWLPLTRGMRWLVSKSVWNYSQLELRRSLFVAASHLTSDRRLKQQNRHFQLWAFTVCLVWLQTINDDSFHSKFLLPVGSLAVTPSDDKETIYLSVSAGLCAGQREKERVSMFWLI